MLVSQAFLYPQENRQYSKYILHLGWHKSQKAAKSFLLKSEIQKWNQHANKQVQATLRVSDKEDAFNYQPNKRGELMTKKRDLYRENKGNHYRDGGLDTSS